MRELPRFDNSQNVKMSPSFTPTAKLPRFENSRNVEMKTGPGPHRIELEAENRDRGAKAKALTASGNRGLSATSLATPYLS